MEMAKKLQQDKKASFTHLSRISLRKPNITDGAAVHSLISRCTPLDSNSMYCNLLQCFHFSDNAILAEENKQLIGFISGYRLPQQPDTLFIWQVAVDPCARGQGLASKMLLQLLANQNGEVQHLHTTITSTNDASWNTFQRLARTLNAPFNSYELFNRQQHLDGMHDSEFLMHIGPFSLNTQEKSNGYL